jgi:hypothetical protein
MSGFARIDKTRALDLRRQKQIANQIASINRLLKDGSYDEEMATLHAELAKARSTIDAALLEAEASDEDPAGQERGEHWHKMLALLRGETDG